MTLRYIEIRCIGHKFKKSLPLWPIMLLRLSSVPAGPAAPGLLVQGDTIFARRKTEYSPAKRTVFLAEHLLVFVVRGTKFLHLPGQTLTAAPNSLILLKRGIYVMAEYIE